MVPEAIAHVTQPFSFAVISDTHFVTRDVLEQELALRPLNAEGYLENVTYSLAPMMDALRAETPDFVVLTGDVAEPSPSSDFHRKNLEAALDFFATCDIPMLVVRGNQDGDSIFDEVVIPRAEKFLGYVQKETFFSFDVGGARFIVLDTAFWDKAQCQWLENELKLARQDLSARTFLFGHHPIWPLSRAFFSNFEFQFDIRSLLDQYAIDAYFCGHSHNQNILLHRTDGLPVLQCMGALIGAADELPLPLNHVQSFLPSRDDLVAIWPGYLENTAPGWFMAQVDSGFASVEWRHLNRGAEAVVRWQSPGDLQTFWTMDQVPGAQLIESDLHRIRRAFLRFCAWDSKGDARIVFNGDEIGFLPAKDGFGSGRVDVPGLSQLQMENKLQIEPAEGSEMTLGNLVLEVVLPGGRQMRTQIFEDIYTWSDRWDAQNLDTLKKLEKGTLLATVLSFR